MTDPNRIGAHLEGSLKAITALRDQIPTLNAIAALAEELIGRYRRDRSAIAAVCLNADPTALTCIANDFGYEAVFARQCQALLGPADVLLVLSTSGRSPNIVEALRVARQRGAATVGLLGNGGGPCAELCDQILDVAGDHSAHVQEAHQVALHVICELVEEGLARSD
jgi:D-sedoheptulose 7-phosphate isomerase